MAGRKGRSGGQNRKPTTLHILHGTDRPSRIPANEPKPEPVAPQCPAALKGEARAEWERMVPQLLKLGLLSKLDRGALAGYCLAWADLIWATEWLRNREKVTSSGPQGIQRLHPVMKARRDAARQMLDFAREFGLTPVARSRIDQVGGGSEADEQEKAAREILGC